MKKVLTLIILSLLVYSWYFIFYTRSHPTSVKLTSIASNLTLYTEPGAGKDFIINAIDSAQKEIDVEVYLLSDTDIITALKTADKSGIEVKVILEEHPFGGSGLNPKSKKDLETAGVEVHWASSDFALTHEKSIIIDDKIALILNQNLTTSSFKENREYDILDTNKNDIAEIKKIFAADWDKKDFIPSITNIIESPNTTRPALSTLLNSAQKEIKIEVEVLDDEAITSLLIGKSRTIPIEIIIPTLKQISSNNKDVQKLIANNIEVKTMSSPYVHAKAILIDGKYAYLGSVNLSSQSLDQNRELGIILSQADLLQTLSSTFEADWLRVKDL